MNQYLVDSPYTPFTIKNQFKAISNGKVYIGEVDKDPLNPSQQIQVYVVNESGVNVPVIQPIQLNSGGYLVYNGQVSKFVTLEPYSIVVLSNVDAEMWRVDDISKVDPDNITASTIPTSNGGSVQDFIDAQYTTVAELATGKFHVGQHVRLTDRAMGLFLLHSGGTPNGTYVLDAGNNNTATYQFLDEINIDHLGAGPNISTIDSSPAINAAFELAFTKGYVFSNAALESYGYLGAKPEVTACTAAYYLGSTINIQSNYDNFDFSNALFLPHSSFVDTNYAFDMEVWNSEIKRIRLAKFKLGIYAHNNNLDNGVVVFESVQASNVDKLFQLDLRSTQTVVEKYRLDNVKIVAEVLNGDKVIFDKGFFSAGVFDTDADAHFVMNSSESPGLELLRMFYVPRPQTAVKTSIVKILNSPTRVTMDCGLFGGEPGSITLVANYVTGSSSDRGCHITLNNTMSFMSSGGVPVIPQVQLYALPNSVVINDSTGFIENSHARNLINFSSDIRTFSSAKALLEAANAQMQIVIGGRSIDNYIGYTYEQARTIGVYDVSPLKNRRKLFSQINNASTEILFAATEAGRGATYKVMMFAPDNNGPDRYSEYVITCTPQAAPYAQWIVLTITQATSTVGGTLFESSGSILIRGNSVAATDIYVIVQELSNVDVYS